VHNRPRCVVEEAGLPPGFFVPAIQVLDGSAGVSVIYWRKAKTIRILFIGAGGSRMGHLERLASKENEVGAQSCDGDLATRSVLESFSKFGGGLSVPTCELPEVADSSFCSCGYITPMFAGGTGQPFTEVIVHEDSPNR